MMDPIQTGDTFLLAHADTNVVYVVLSVRPIMILYTTFHPPRVTIYEMIEPYSDRNHWKKIGYNLI